MTTSTVRGRSSPSPSPVRLRSTEQPLSGLDQGTHRATCRFCGAPLHHTVVDLGTSPLCESFVPPDRLDTMEPFYPLHVFVCGECFLVQLLEYVPPEEIFTDYAYYSAYSDTWLAHAKKYVDQMTELLELGKGSQVVELGSNDGYLLQCFIEKGIPSLGIEPAANVARAAEARGVETLVKFFDADLAEKLRQDGRAADLVIGNNVLAQVPNLNSFVEGINLLLAPNGVVTIEFPHLLRLIESNQFDTIYHEHFSYFSFSTAERIFAAHGLTLFDVEELPTHGGSLRIYGRHQHDAWRPVSSRVLKLKEEERTAGLDSLEVYATFQERVEETKRALLEFLISARRQGKQIVGYGAPGKGNTLLNYCGIRTDFIDYTVDRNPFKHGMFLPGTHIPIYPPEKIAETKPDYIVILPWNLKDEIAVQLAYTAAWGAKLVVPIPEVEVLS
ncbi:MAG: class I SAM-dependent methyltransferase [Acidimicrobiia bacterium]|nr:class I SAM-dependent methyltransferase [Acidimicrobiia bacterium]